MGEAARRLVETEYDARFNSHRLLDVLRSVTDRAHTMAKPALAATAAARGD
jgi:hypothetical protein